MCCPTWAPTAPTSLTKLQRSRPLNTSPSSQNSPQCSRIISPLSNKLQSRSSLTSRRHPKKNRAAHPQLRHHPLPLLLRPRPSCGPTCCSHNPQRVCRPCLWTVCLRLGRFLSVVPVWQTSCSLATPTPMLSPACPSTLGIQVGSLCRSMLAGCHLCYLPAHMTICFRESRTECRPREWMSYPWVRAQLGCPMLRRMGALPWHQGAATRRTVDRLVVDLGAG